MLLGEMPYRLSPKLGNIVPVVLTPVVAMIHGFSMAWHSQVSSGSASAPEPSSGSGGLISGRMHPSCQRSRDDDCPFSAIRFIKARTTKFISSRELFRRAD